MEVEKSPGSHPPRKIRYAIVGLGSIARDHMMPGVPHTDNSDMTAFVTSDPGKARPLGGKYDVNTIYRYEDFPQALASGTFDAI